MAAADEGRRQLIKYIEDAHALESHLIQTLGDHVKDAQDEPMMRQKIEQHLRETEVHRERLEQRLNALGVGKPGMKTSISGLFGQVMGSIAGSRGTGLAKDVRDEYVSECMEVAQYLQLITVAQAVGDMDTVRVAQANLRDEIAMQQWLIEHVPEATLRSLAQEGVQLPAGAMQNAQNVVSAAGLGAVAQTQTMGAGQPGYGAGTQQGYDMGTQRGADVGQPSGIGTGQPGVRAGQPGTGQPFDRGVGQPGVDTGQPGVRQPPNFDERQGPVMPGNPDQPPPIVP